MLNVSALLEPGYGVVSEHVELQTLVPPRRAESFPIATAAVGTSSMVLEWTERRTVVQDGRLSPGVPVDAMYISGQWIFTFHNPYASPIPGDVSLVATTEAGTGKLLEVREET